MGDVLALAARLLALPEGPPAPPAAQGEEEVHVFRAAPAYLTLRTLMALVTGLLPAGLLALGLLGAAWATPRAEVAGLLRLLALGVALLGALQAGLAVLLVRVDYALRHYVLTPRALRIREGVLTVRELTLSFENVQHVAVTQGPLERLLGLATVVVDTAGGGAPGHEGGPGAGSVRGHRGLVRGVDNAPQVRALLLRRLEACGRKSGLGDREEEAPGGFSAAEVAALRALREEVAALAAAVRGP